MKLKPLADRLVAKSLEAEATTKSGLYIPDTAQEKPQMGEVMAVGKEVKEVKTGDRILYTKYGPNEIKLEGEELLILKEEDVLAVVEK